MTHGSSMQGGGEGEGVFVALPLPLETGAGVGLEVEVGSTKIMFNLRPIPGGYTMVSWL